MDRKRILLVEDGETCGKLFETILTHTLGCDVHWAKDGPAARAGLAEALAAGCAPDLIQMDIALPGESGWELIRDFKADPAARAIPIYVVTACGLTFKDDLAYERSLIAAEMEKPIDMASYTQMVRRVLRGIGGNSGEKVGAAA